MRRNCLMREQSPPSSWSRLYRPTQPVASHTTSLRDFRILQRSVIFSSLGKGFDYKNTHTAREQMVLAPVLVRCTVAKALPWVNVSVT